jgi:hypothetical protein
MRFSAIFWVEILTLKRDAPRLEDHWTLLIKTTSPKLPPRAAGKFLPSGDQAAEAKYSKLVIENESGAEIFSSVRLPETRI